MDPLTYGIEDFLCDTTFLNYCLGKDPEHVEFWEDWLLSHPEKTAMVNEAKRIYYDLNGQTTDLHFKAEYEYFQQAFKLHLEEAGTPLQTPVKAISKPKISISRKLWLAGSSAAAVLLLVSLFFIINNRITAKQESLVSHSPKGQKRTVILEDGTKVALNGDSKLTVSTDFNGTERNVTLEGEGFFTVAHNKAKPFIVHTSKVMLKVLGTVFNMKAYPSDKTVETTLISGSVEISVNVNPASKVILVPNKKFILGNKADIKVLDLPFTGKKPIVQEIDWTKNKLSFRNESLENIIPEIERWYGVQIIVKNPSYKSVTYTASYDNEPLEQVLSSLELTGGFKYRKEESGKIVIY